MASTRTTTNEVYDERNLVVATTFPVFNVQQLRNDLVDPISYRRLTANPPDAAAVTINIERPILHVQLDLPNGTRLHVINVHLKSKIPTDIPGQKIDNYTWRSADAWAEGSFISSMKRMSQALEVRRSVDQILDADPRAQIVVAGDFQRLTTRHDLALRLGQTGRVGEAITKLEQLLIDDQRVFGPNHPDTLLTRFSLAKLYGKADLVDDAIGELEQLLVDQLRVLGPDHPDTLTTRHELAHWSGEAGLVDDAIAQAEQLIADRTGVLGANHPETLATRNNLACQLIEAGRTDEAISQFQQLLSDEQRVLGSTHPDTLNTRGNLGKLVQQRIRLMRR